ncbi:hypothetical protein [Shewanella sp. MR-4]|uniref:hypothetical protein n=1 Tax=Shewanella sp. (strain MR-4) TaxID=60480 RepID=UPI00059D028C|nr:hypothetical protein [Shewanella sp. MR-4]
MKPITRWISLSLLLIAALSAYAYGNATSAITFILFGMLLEGTFWIGLLGKKASLTYSKI